MKGFKRVLFLALSLTSFIAIGEFRATGDLKLWQAILLGGVIGGLFSFMFGRNKAPDSSK